MLPGQLIGRGNTAEVYEVRDNDTAVLKLFYEKLPLEYIKKEFETSRLIHQLEIPSPSVEDMVNFDQMGHHL